MNRRDFLQRSTKTSLGVAAGWTILRNAKSVRAAPANDRVVLASVGVRGRGGNLAAGFAERPDCRIAYICDVDSNLFAATVKRIAPIQGGKRAGLRARLPQGTGRQVGRRDRRGHARSLALPGDDLGLPGRKRRLRGEAAEPSARGRAARPSRPRGSTSASCRCGMQNRSAAYVMAAKKYLERRSPGQGLHVPRVRSQGRSGSVGQLSRRAGPRSAGRLRLGHVERPGPGGPLQRQLHQPLAQPVALCGGRMPSTTPSTSSTSPAG